MHRLLDSSRVTASSGMLAISPRKQEALDAFDRELSLRVSKLRETYAHLTRSLVTQTEMRIARMPTATRTLALKEVLPSMKDTSRQHSTETAGERRDPPSSKSIGMKRKTAQSPTTSTAKTIKKGRVTMATEARNPSSRRAKKGE